jgi:hypothetical protein
MGSPVYEWYPAVPSADKHVRMRLRAIVYLLSKSVGIPLP